MQQCAICCHTSIHDCSRRCSCSGSCRSCMRVCNLRRSVTTLAHCQLSCLGSGVHHAPLHHRGKLLTSMLGSVSMSAPV